MTDPAGTLRTRVTGYRRGVGYDRPTMHARIALLAAAAIVVVGCSSATAPSREAPSPTPASVAPSLVPQESASMEPGAIQLPASIIDPVVADIAKTAGVPVDQVVVISAESMTFPDGSLGCPQPGMAYTQILVDGYQIVAKVNGVLYDYRGSGTSFQRCMKGVS
jgi:hypothetical protein